MGTGEDIPIAGLADLVREAVYPKAKLVCDSGKPYGTPRKLLDVSRLRALGWKHQIPLAHGVLSTYEWFLEQQSAE